MLKTYILHPEALNKAETPSLLGEPDWCLPQGIDVSANLTAYLRYSGKSPNDFGLWDSCQALRGDPTLRAISPPHFVNL